MSLTIQGPSVADQIREATRAKSSAHWYRVNGEPCHSRLTKQGKERATNLRDARKENLYPSVTSILGILNKKGLEQWKQNNLLKSAWDKRELVADFEKWLKEVVASSWEVSKEAMQFGTDWHHMAESYATTGKIENIAPQVEPYVDEFKAWFDEKVVEVVSSEQSVVHPLGFAGTRDLVFKHKDYPGLVVGDYKTQNVNEKYGPKVYPEHALQLAAYHQCKIEGNTDPVVCLSIIIDSNKPAPLHEHVWPAEEINDAWETFCHCLAIWQAQNKYKPSPGQ